MSSCGDMTQHNIFNRHNRTSVSLDSLGSQTDDESANTSPASVHATDSPIATFSPSAIPPDKVPKQEDRNVSPSALLDDSKQALKPEKEKRKRSRVTPEQLVHLERFFLIDRSPTATRRRDISELLGMQERQTQIWFQNRRAKAKLQDTKQGSREAEASPDSSTGLPGSRYDSTVHKLIHEDEPVSIIPCTDLTIGTWRRISSPGDIHDLVAYVCETKRCLNWFIHSGGYGFKMEIPFNTVTDTEYKIIGPHTGVASFILSQPPIFYLENITSLVGDESPVRTWKRCSDWTEGHQASKVLRHTVLGSDTELVYLLRTLHPNPGTSSLGARGNAYRSDGVSASPMELQPPPLAGLGVVHASYADAEIKDHAGSADMRKRASYSMPDERYPAPRGDLLPPPHAHNASPAAYARNGFMHPIHTPSTTPNFESGVYSNYSTTGQPAPEPSGYAPLAGGAGLYSRPYVPQSQSYYDNGRILQPFQQDIDEMSPRITQSRGYSNASLTGFATKYHSEMHRDRHPQQPQHLHQGSSNSSLSDMPGMMYAQADNNTYSC